MQVRFPDVRTALTACRQNKKEVSVILTFARASVYETAHAQNVWLPPALAGPNAFYAVGSSFVCVFAALLGKVTSILDLVDLHIFTDLLALSDDVRYIYMIKQLLCAFPFHCVLFAFVKSKICISL